MQFFYTVFDFVIHINVYLDLLVSALGGWIYALLFLIIFCETGLVVTPFLPGDSLLFAAGAIASRGGMNIFILVIVLIAASILGDMVNYLIGRFLGEKLVRRYPKLIKPDYIARTHKFFEHYGAKTIVLCRFVPIVRTVAPFVAGAGSMTYSKFMRFNILGALLWVLTVTPAGYFFANIQFVEDNFSLVLAAVVLISIMPAVAEVIRERRKKNNSTA